MLIVTIVLHHKLGINSLLFIHHILSKLNFLRLARQALRSYQYCPLPKTFLCSCVKIMKLMLKFLMLVFLENIWQFLGGAQCNCSVRIPTEFIQLFIFKYMVVLKKSCCEDAEWKKSGVISGPSILCMVQADGA